MLKLVITYIFQIGAVNGSEEFRLGVMMNAQMIGKLMPMEVLILQDL